MKVLTNGWTWVGLLLAWMAFRPAAPPDVSGELRVCQSVQAATEAQLLGLGYQTVMLQSEVERQRGELVKANQWAAGMRRVVGQLELQCRTVRP
jgi:hypothetical protein